MPSRRASPGTLLLSAAVAGAVWATPISVSHAQQRVEAGLLECQVEPGIGLVIASSKRLTCVFTGADRPPERYAGQITRVGIDIGFTGPGYIAWAVLAPSIGFAPGALAGSYAGVSAEATTVVGVGANALIGGGDRSFVLQPISVSAQTGVNFAVGVTALDLFPA